MFNRFVPEMIIFGRRDIGRGIQTMVTTGCQARGYCRLNRDCFGHLGIGSGAETGSFSLRVTGDRSSDSMAGSIMDSATSATGMKAAAGSTDIFSTTAK